MPQYTTDLLIGSYPALPAQSISVTVGATTEVIVLPAGNYYLTDGTPGRSLLDALETAIGSHSLLLPADIEVRLLRNRSVRVASADACSVQWPSDGVLRDLLGFATNLSPAATSFAAPGISPLLWSAARTATYEARYATNGILVHDTAVGQSAPGIVTATAFNSYRTNTLMWRYVLNDRVWTSAEAGGQFVSFWGHCLRRMVRFKVYRNTTEDTTASTAITLGTVLPSSGAYIYAPTERVGAMPFGREFGFHEYTHPITIPVVSSPEYT